MTELKDLKRAVKEALAETRVKRYKGLSEIHIMDVEEAAGSETRVEPGRSPKPSASTSKATDDLISSLGDEPEEPTAMSYAKAGELTEQGRGALKMNTIWANNLTQIMNFNKGRELAQLIASRLQNQSGLPAQQMLPIVTAVMKATLEQLDDEVNDQIQKEMPGVLDITRG